MEPLLSTLASSDDRVWPCEQWPAMRLDKGLSVGSKGGHGPIGYFVTAYEKGRRIDFEFIRPKEFVGKHWLEIKELDAGRTELKHTIHMQANGLGALKWSLAIRWLHDALIEDAFNKVENQITGGTKRSQWNPWVKLLRKVLSP